MPVLCPKCSNQIGEIRSGEFVPFIPQDQIRELRDPDNRYSDKIIALELTCSCGYEWVWKPRQG